ncbi:MAG: hypothetical protein WCK93_03675 [Nitrosomonadales bacterium]
MTFDEATHETLGRAVLFSLDVSPSWILQDGGDYAKSYRILKHTEFAYRLKAAEDYGLANGCVFKTDLVNPEQHPNLINLRKFVRWAAEQRKWEVPERFKGCAQVKAIPAAKVEAVPKVAHDEKLAALFDPVPVEALEKMFQANGDWRKWAERAARNGLKDAAKEGRGKFNPYKAAVWFVNQGISGWDLAHCYRVLANNLPARSFVDKHLLTGDID